MSPLTMYSPLKDRSENSFQSSEDHESLLSGSEKSYGKPPPRTLIWVPILVLPIISVFLVGFGVWIGSHWFTNTNAVCLAHVQNYCKSNNSETTLTVN